MGRQRHKRKKHQMVILASDAVDAGIQQFRYRPWILRTVVLILSALIGVAIGYFYFEKDVWAERDQKTSTQQEQIDALERDKAELENEVASLNQTIQLLSETFRQLRLILRLLIDRLTQQLNRLIQ